MLAFPKEHELELFFKGFWLRSQNTARKRLPSLTVGGARCFPSGALGSEVHNHEGQGELWRLLHQRKRKLRDQHLAFISSPVSLSGFQVWTRQECCKEKLIKRQYNALEILSVM